METKKPVYKRVLIKISGEALAGEKKTGLDFEVISDVCAAVKKCTEMGVQVEEFDDSVLVRGPVSLRPTDIQTQPYPGFPTDVHPQICVLLCLAKGVSYLTERVWDNRFRYVEELKRMGAQIKVDGKMAIIEGGTPFSAAPIRAVDLRAGAAMIIAALTAEGRTEIDEVYHIERGYDDIVGKLRRVGSDIRRVTVPSGYELEQAN